MVVPERYRLAAGKREWKYSLETSDESEARLRHAEKLAHIRRYMAGLDVQEAASVGDRADEVVARGMTVLARSNIVHQASIGLNFDMARGIDNVTYAISKVLSFRVRLAWGQKHAAPGAVGGEVAEPGSLAVDHARQVKGDARPIVGGPPRSLGQHVAHAAQARERPAGTLSVAASRAAPSG